MARVCRAPDVPAARCPLAVLAAHGARVPRAPAGFSAEWDTLSAHSAATPHSADGVQQGLRALHAIDVLLAEVSARVTDPFREARQKWVCVCGVRGVRMCPFAHVTDPFRKARQK